MDQVILLPIPEPPGYDSQGEKTKTIIHTRQLGHCPLPLVSFSALGTKKVFLPWSWLGVMNDLDCGGLQNCKMLIQELVLCLY
jgi:hypothetical protein